MRVFPSLIMLGNASDRSADFNLHTKDARHMDHGHVQYLCSYAVLSMIEYEYPFGIRLFPRCVGLGRRERKKEETLG